MALHHFVTVWLIGLSYTYGWTRVGAVVMVLLDPADVPLHIAKQFKYVGDVRGGARKKSCQAAADFFFMVFMFLFAIMRLGLYPYVVWTAHRESAPYWKQQIGGRTCIILLYVLLALQIYWFTLVLRVAIKVITCGSAEDVRSDDDEDDSSEHKKRK
jgi:ceramide synthetase